MCSQLIKRKIILIFNCISLMTSFFLLFMICPPIKPQCVCLIDFWGFLYIRIITGLCQLQIFFLKLSSFSYVLNRNCHEPWSMPYATNSGFVSSLRSFWGTELWLCSLVTRTWGISPMFQLCSNHGMISHAFRSQGHRTGKTVATASLGSLDNRILFPFHPSLCPSLSWFL